MKALQRTILLAVILLLVQGLSAQVQVKFSIQPDSLKPGESGQIKATMSIPSDLHQTYIPGEEDFFYLKAVSPHLIFGKTIYPKPDKIVVENEWSYYKSVTLSLPFQVRQDIKQDLITISVEFGYNVCLESGACMPPETVEKKLSVKVILNPDTAVQSSDVADDASEVVDKKTEELESIPVSQAQTSASDLWKYLLMAFLGGLILNATPCVLPILPIRIMKIMNQAQSDEKKVLANVLLYTLGVMLSFAILAAIFIGLRAAGESAGWGMQNQNPGFVIALMSIVFVFALSLLGIFEIRPPSLGSVNQATAKSGYSGSFFGGVFAFLMAISCTGPFLGLALPFAFKLSPIMMLVFFLIIGLGFSFPFILIGFFKGALKLFPKPGEWMVIFKQLMGFVLLWIVYTQLKTLLILTDSEYLLKVLWFLIVTGFSVWLYGRFVRYEHSKATQWIFTIIPVLLIISAAVIYLPMDSVQPDNQEITVEGMVQSTYAPQGWYVFSEDLLNKALQEGRAVFLDIGAEWCKNCKTNEKTVLFTESMMNEFKTRNVLLLKGDFTRKDKKLFEWITKHDRIGVPFNALYIPGKEPVIFNELITKTEVMNALNQISE